MYLNIGGDLSVRSSSIIGIFHMDNTTVTQRGREFLDRAGRNHEVVSCDLGPEDDGPKSYILTVQYGGQRIYECAVTTATLEKRLK